MIDAVLSDRTREARHRSDSVLAPYSIGRCAIRALYHELALTPKPGLVSFVDTGSHDDMDARTFMRSVFALRGYFVRVAELGARYARFEALEAAALAAEARMFAATGGVNTHRGAIFTLGLLCAASGAYAAEGRAVDAHSIRTTLRNRWGDALHARAERRRRATVAPTHGQSAYATYSVRNASDEAALGFPAVFDVAIPALRTARAMQLDSDAASVQTLFKIIAVLDDTNLVYRGGEAGLRFAQSQAQAFLDAGGVARNDWRARAAHIHRAFVARRLSPGGAADVLAAAWFVEHIGALTR